ncbi:MAG: FGGY family carbohydrate kinase [Bacillota bacterium]|nr:FGGY family carbohydrate kinase [Bacillota bacterium]
MAERLFLGIDVGTQGARALAVNEAGEVLAEASQDFPLSGAAPLLPEGWFEQPPVLWWKATREAIARTVSLLRRAGHHPSRIHAVSVTSTSGTILALDEHCEPLGPAIMYNDRRSGAQAARVNAAAEELTAKLGYKFNASFGLPKMLWLKEQRPDLFARTRLFAHAGDYILTKLCGESGITDYSTALKSGYDLVAEAWPAFIEDFLGLPLSTLPTVLPPGTPIGRVTAECAAATGLARSTLVVLGMTDGCTSQIASGAVRPGAWNTTIGTTLVLKGVTSRLLLDPKGRIYSHRHPDGYWMPGGASNVGGDCLELHFQREEFDALNRAIRNRPPTTLLIYPLQKKGERFPIVDPEAEGFVAGQPADRYELYQGYLEGVGYVERLAYDVLSRLGAEVGKRIYVAGGATKSPEWLRIRASILNKTLQKPKVTGAHMGAAILAASRTHWGSLCEAADRMVTVESETSPDPALTACYADRYRDFLAEMSKRGYLASEEV